jgi:capsular exopolysaccharide synthesis family protein
MDEQAPGLRDVWRMLVRHRALIAAVAGAVTAASLVFSVTQPKAYASTARLFTQAPLNQVVIQALTGSGSGRANVDLSPKDIAELIDSSTPIARIVIDKLKLDNTPEQLVAVVKARVLTDGIIEVSATAQRPELAQALAQGFAEGYLTFRAGQVVAEIDGVLRPIEGQIAADRKSLADLGGSYQGLNERIALLSPPGIVLSAGQAAEKGRLIAQRDGVKEQMDALSARIADAEGRVRQLGIGKGAVNPGWIVKDATLSRAPASPKPAVDGAVGLMIGLVAGVVAAYLRNHLDRRIRTRDDAARLSGAPVLAAVPRAEARGAPSPDRLASIAAPAGPVAEQYRTLRANLAAQGLGGSIRALLVTSPGRGEGKSSTVANLAVACANSGLKTLAVSADPRRPTLHAFFEVPDAPGLPEVLRGHAPLSAAIFMTAVPNLFVLPSRPDPATGSDLLASQRLQEVLAEATAHADIVLVDVTAIADGADASILARLVGNCLLVVEADHTDRTSVSRAATTITHAGARIVGTVLNRASATDETAGVPERTAGPAYDPATNGRKLPQPPLVLSRPWGDSYTPPRGLPSPRPQGGQRTWEGEEG